VGEVGTATFVPAVAQPASSAATTTAERDTGIREKDEISI
jgi:hypothetical protein